MHEKIIKTITIKHKITRKIILKIKTASKTFFGKKLKQAINKIFYNFSCLSLVIMRKITEY